MKVIFRWLGVSQQNSPNLDFDGLNTAMYTEFLLAIRSHEWQNKILSLYIVSRRNHVYLQKHYDPTQVIFPNHPHNP